MRERIQERERERANTIAGHTVTARLAGKRNNDGI